MPAHKSITKKLIARIFFAIAVDRYVISSIGIESFYNRYTATTGYLGYIMDGASNER